MSVPYGDDYEPPAPVLDLAIVSPRNCAGRVRIRALVDTGSDGTILECGIAAQIGLPFLGYVQVRGIHGRSESAPVLRAIIEMPPYRFETIVAELGAETILGRDILNRLSLRLDGPKLQLSLS